MSIWFTSDTHFFDKNVLRQFKTKDNAVAALIKNWNETVGPNDLVFHLGDVTGEDWHYSRLRTLVPKLNGVKVLIPGNHDKVWKQGTSKPLTVAAQFKKYEDLGFIIFCSRMIIDLPELRFVLQHKPPIAKNRNKLRQHGWRLHGHSHETWRIKGNMINVGVDQWNFRPVHLDQIKELIKAEQNLTKYLETGSIDDILTLRGQAA